MPQLDIVSFFSQTFWFFLSFFFFYSVLLNKIVFHFGFIKKLRSFKVKQILTDIDFHNKESLISFKVFNNLFLKSSSDSFTTLNKVFYSATLQISDTKNSTVAAMKKNNLLLIKNVAYFSVQNQNIYKIFFCLIIFFY